MYVDRGTIVGIATRYGLDGPEIQYRCLRELSYPTRPAIGPRILLHNGDQILLPQVNRPGRGVSHPLYLAPKFKNEYS